MFSAMMSEAPASASAARSIQSSLSASRPSHSPPSPISWAGQPARSVLEPERTADGAAVSLVLAPDALFRLRVLPAEKSSDPGYDYSWYCG